jgi:chromosome segregation ATPase
LREDLKQCEKERDSAKTDITTLRADLQAASLDLTGPDGKVCSLEKALQSMKVRELDLQSQATEGANAIGSLQTEVCDYQRRITQLVSRGSGFQFMSVALQVICSIRHTKVLESRREIENRSQQLEALSRAWIQDGLDVVTECGQL